MEGSPLGRPERERPRRCRRAHAAIDFPLMKHRRATLPLRRSLCRPEHRRRRLHHRSAATVSYSSIPLATKLLGPQQDFPPRLSTGSIVGEAPRLTPLAAGAEHHPRSSPHRFHPNRARDELSHLL
ncbi:hypothetical protein DAI22_07g124000 [Oryza sativa Japonica Group]|nr:hypothetical protein DAI22_07g124000 [Oryza sativa Japonica Group]